MDINQLNRDFGLGQQLEFISGFGDLPFIKISNHHAQALISLYGAQVVSFQSRSHPEELLFLSEQSHYAEGKAIRGGIPVCWPWFGPDPKGLQRPNHGFVRNHYWQVQRTDMHSAEETKITLGFNEGCKKENTWRQPFALVLEITIAQALTLKLTTHNTGDKVFSITQAFHNYFRVGDIKKVQVLGLEGCDYFDKLDQGTQKLQQGVITVTEEVDRVYMNAIKPLVIEDRSLQRRINIRSPNTNTAVVWNPWSNTARKMSDLANTDYQRFICVEVGNIAFDLIQIQPGDSYSLEAEFSLSPL